MTDRICSVTVRVNFLGGFFALDLVAVFKLSSSGASADFSRVATSTLTA